MTEPIDGGTATLAGARDHARAQAGAHARSPRTVPSAAAVDLPNGVQTGDVVWDELVPGGNYASRRVPRGSVLRVTDLEGDACVQLLVYNATQPSERLNVMDTVKVQWQAYLGPNALLLSDMGRVLMTIVSDTSARHDCLCGGTNRALAERKYGPGGVESPTPNARDLLCLAGAKHGLERADIGPSLNLFKGARVEDDGALVFDGETAPGRHIELRAELAVIVLVANTPHPLDPRADYVVTPVRCTAWRDDARDVPDRSATTPERERAYENTDEFVLTVDP